MQDRDTEPKAFDPIALSLALWLGLVVAAMGLQRLSEQAALQEVVSGPTASVTPAQMMLAFGS